MRVCPPEALGSRRLLLKGFRPQAPDQATARPRLVPAVLPADRANICQSGVDWLVYRARSRAMSSSVYSGAFSSNLVQPSSW